MKMCLGPSNKTPNETKLNQPTQIMTTAHETIRAQCAKVFEEMDTLMESFTIETLSPASSPVSSPVSRNADRKALRIPGPYDERKPKNPCCRGIVNGTPCTKVFCVNQDTGKPYLSPSPEYFNRTQQLCKKCYEIVRKDPNNERVVVNGRKILMTRLR